MRRRFGARTQKISLNRDSGCPNRDHGTGLGGCGFCRVESFTPGYCLEGLSLGEQFQRGQAFFSQKGNGSLSLAYLQTYSQALSNPQELKALLQELKALPDCRGVIIATRPDLVTQGGAEVLGEFAQTTPLTVELGVQSTLDTSLRTMGRGHTMADSIGAFELLARHGVETGAHIILGLPHEGYNDYLHHARVLNELPLAFLKIHHLQVLRGTAYEDLYRREPGAFGLGDLTHYVKLCGDFLELLRPDIVIERFVNESPRDILVHPHWDGAKNYTVSSMVGQELVARGSWQGRLWDQTA